MSNDVQVHTEVQTSLIRSDQVVVVAAPKNHLKKVSQIKALERNLTTNSNLFSEHGDLHPITKTLVQVRVKQHKTLTGIND
jgi:hypothetical protein